MKAASPTTARVKPFPAHSRPARGQAPRKTAPPPRPSNNFAAVAAVRWPADRFFEALRAELGL